MHSDNSESLTPSLEQSKKNDHFGLGGWLGHHHHGVLMAPGEGTGFLGKIGGTEKASDFADLKDGRATNPKTEEFFDSGQGQLCVL